MSAQPELEAAEPSDAQRASAVYRHPMRLQLEALLARRTPDWVAAWLRDQYPLTDADGIPYPDAHRRERLHLSARAITKYRDRFLPQYKAGVDVVPASLEDLIGRVAPTPRRQEIDRLEVLAQVAVHNLQKAMKMDEDLEMLQPITLQAQDAAMNVTLRTIDVKSKLGVPGYEEVPKAQNIKLDATHQSINVELHGRVDPRTGEQIPNEPERVDALREVLRMGPDAVMEVVAAAKARAAEAVNGTAEEVEPDGDE